MILPKGTRFFFCPECKNVEAVEPGAVVGDVAVYGSAVDFCSRCETPRTYRDDGTVEGVCEGELVLTSLNQLVDNMKERYEQH